MYIVRKCLNDGKMFIVIVIGLKLVSIPNLLLSICFIQLFLHLIKLQTENIN